MYVSLTRVYRTLVPEIYVYPAMLCSFLYIDNVVHMCDCQLLNCICKDHVHDLQLLALLAKLSDQCHKILGPREDGPRGPIQGRI